ncbi:hypothetical protein [Paracoccus contaminans]|uniref:hypothetical protein n=1 Tax=Paracoccus contaminans TaxID=1945662 RepID=UPI000A18DD19|nr:hypothetical protein [Paracoccus contaminans]
MLVKAACHNIVTRGIHLIALVGRCFSIGKVVCARSTLAKPHICLRKTTPPGMTRCLVHRAGLRADILADGTIRCGHQGVRPIGLTVQACRL